jgi:hypothetical protein
MNDPVTLIEVFLGIVLYDMLKHLIRLLLEICR